MQQLYPEYQNQVSVLKKTVPEDLIYMLKNNIPIRKFVFEKTRSISHEDLNERFGDKSRFFKHESDALSYKQFYKNKYPNLKCFTCKIYNHSYEHGNKFVEGYLVSTPEGTPPIN